MRVYESAVARYPAGDRGRCTTCGFLAKHRSGGPWHEVGHEDRESGRNFYKAPGGSINTAPACLRHAANLEEEHQRNWATRKVAGDNSPDAEFAAVRAVIGADRHCSEWYPYTAGFSPKEHWEEWRMVQLEEERRANDLALAQLRAESESRSRDIASTLLEVTRETGNFTTVWTHWAVGLAAAGVALALLGVLLLIAAYVFPDLGRHVGQGLGWFAVASPSPSATP